MVQVCKNVIAEVCDGVVLQVYCMYMYIHTYSAVSAAGRMALYTLEVGGCTS